jgi:hypothetical protein
VSKNGGAKSFAKQLGWQEALSKLFILRPISMETSDLDVFDCDITMEKQADCDENRTKGGNSDETCLKGDDSEQNAEKSPLLRDYDSPQGISAISPNNIVNGHNCDSEIDQKSDKGNCDSSKEFSVQKPSPPTHLNLSPGGDATHKESVEFFSSSLNTPSTPLYLKSQLFGDLGASGPDDYIQPMSRSSSASAEDLSTIAQRAAERKSLQKDVSSSSISQLSQSESGIDLAEEVEMRRDSLSSSWHQNNTHRMLNSLGLRGSFLMDVVENSEELCQNLLIILYTVMWKGVEGSDEAAWKVKKKISYVFLNVRYAFHFANSIMFCIKNFVMSKEDKSIQHVNI